ncbi:HAD family hydrolase [Catellatospora coxensis]|uniref:Phosphatase n=1 Tax=Catellatospora coxensis TaxID=310354 RepID=A0A8J3KS68_9ACTN|nr:HAD hydrolase-like protein [Catellatospora coxensis]GIG05233.1 phosphatase [Catellatospora coxensis]
MKRGAKHLVWDWNGTLVDDLHLVVSSTNAAFAAAAPGLSIKVTADEHRRDFRRPISEYYGSVLGRTITEVEFADLDRVFHDAYRTGLAELALAAGAVDALRGWTGTQSLLSMWFHEELVPTVTRYELTSHFIRVDGLRERLGGEQAHKAGHLKRHLAELCLEGADVVLIGDSIDDADAAASVGARCVLYTGGFTDPAKLRAYGVPVADSLLEAIALAA